MTLLTASRKSFSVTVFLLARIAYIPASVHTLLISAPGINQINEKVKSEPLTVVFVHLITTIVENLSDAYR